MKRSIQTAQDMEPDRHTADLMMKLNLCLCGRNPESNEVREELLKAIILCFRYKLVSGGCLVDVADAFDRIYAGLAPGEIRAIDDLMKNLDFELSEESDLEAFENMVPEGTYLH